MRMSRVLLAGGAVAVAAVATTAFTGSNTFDVTTTVVGYGEVETSGIHVTSVVYNRDAADPTLLEDVVFESAEASDISGLTTTMSLRLGGVLVSHHDCGVPAGSGGAWTITCPAADAPFSTFDAVGLSVGIE
jgi:hypothetical protein